jgi:hypothetical protein
MSLLSMLFKLCPRKLRPRSYRLMTAIPAKKKKLFYYAYFKKDLFQTDPSCLL